MAPAAICTLSLHDALPICVAAGAGGPLAAAARGPPHARRPGDYGVTPGGGGAAVARRHHEDRKSTRLNSSHVSISYAVFCLKNKKNSTRIHTCLPNNTTHH